MSSIPEHREDDHDDENQHGNVRHGGQGDEKCADHLPQTLGLADKPEDTCEAYNAQ